MFDYSYLLLFVLPLVMAVYGVFLVIDFNKGRRRFYSYRFISFRNDREKMRSDDLFSSFMFALGSLQILILIVLLYFLIPRDLMSSFALFAIFLAELFIFLAAFLLPGLIVYAERKDR